MGNNNTPNIYLMSKEAFNESNFNEEAITINLNVSKKLADHIKKIQEDEEDKYLTIYPGITLKEDPSIPDGFVKIIQKR